MATSTEPEWTVVQIVHLDETGDSYHRMRWPGATLAKQEPTWRVLNFHWTATERYDVALSADLLVLFQSNDPFMLDVIRKRKALGKKTLVEYNDNFYEPTPSSPVARDWASPLLQTSYEAFLREADGVIVTGPGLYELFKGHTDKPIHILKNHYHHTPKDFEKLWEQKGKSLNFGWAGSLGHFSDLISVRGVIHKALKEFPESTFHFMGNEELLSSLRIPESRLHFKAWGSMQEYLTFWDDIHIGFTPLLPHPYNECRSDVKALEILSGGALPLLSTVGPYEALLSEVKLPSFGGADELETLLKKFFKSLSSTKKEAKKGFQYLLEHRLAEKNNERKELYSKYFPESSSEMNLPLQAGYFELRGTKENTAPSQQIIERANQLLKEKKRSEAITLLLQYKDDRDLLLQAIRLLLKYYPERGVLECENAIIRFEKDLRFFFELVKRPTSKDLELTSWKRIIRTLSDGSEELRRFYGEEVLRLFLRLAPENKKILSLSKELLEIYPTSQKLNLLHAQYLESVLELKQAKKAYETTLKIIDDQALDNPPQLDREVIQAWVLALNPPKEKNR